MARGASAPWTLCYGACLSMLLSQCQCQFYEPYEDLPDYSFRSYNGTFQFPAGETFIFAEGSAMTIQWSTDFDAVNLYVVYNVSADPPSVGIQRQIATGYSKSTIDWTLVCNPDCEAPFSIKAVDAFGDRTAQMLEGFWSRQFWISPTGTTSSLQASSISSTTSSTTSSTASARPSTTSPAMLTSDSASTPTSTSALTAIPTAAPESAPTSSADSGSNTDTTAIGAGIGAAVGVVLTMCAAFYLWRKRSKRTVNHDPELDKSPGSLYASLPQDKKTPYSSHHPVFEVPGCQVAEAPGSQTAEPQELPGRPV